MVTLKILESTDREEFLKYESEYKANCGREKIPFALNPKNLPFEEFFELTEQIKNEKTCPEELVPAINYLILDDRSKIVGSINLRLRDNDFILNSAGHIGYGITPRQRSKGYATEALNECLFLAKSFDMKRVILTTDTDNEASQKVIQKNGGILQRQNNGTLIYSIDLDRYSIEKSAMAVVFCNGKILATTEDIYGKLVLSLPKGHLEKGETVVDAAVRECFEETNVVLDKTTKRRILTPFETRFIDHHDRRVKKTITPVSFLLDNAGSPMEKELRVKKVEFMPVNEFLQKCTYANVKKVVAEAVRQLGI